MQTMPSIGYSHGVKKLHLLVISPVLMIAALAMSQLGAGFAHDDYERSYLEGYRVPPEVRERAVGLAEKAQWVFKTARAMGVRIACGSDMVPFAEGAKLELAQFVRLGMTPQEALLAGTKVGAEAAGCAEETGTIAVGKTADLLAVETDPLEDISSVRRVRAVWRNGRRTGS